MKWKLFTLLLAGLACPSPGQAQSNYYGPDNTYVGVLYGQLTVDDQDSSFEVETDNFGLVLGGNGESGAGFEIFYLGTINGDGIDNAAGEEIAEAKVSSYGGVALYRSPGQVYVKVKGGFAVVDLDFDFTGAGGNFDDDTSGLTYGATVGVQFGDASLELNYLVLPEFDDFEGLDFDAEVEFFSLGFNWSF